jgi:adenylate cyclase
MSSQLSHDSNGFDRAIQLEQKSIALDNSNALAYAIMSQAYTSTRQYDLGITAAERALAIEPNFAIGHGSLAWALSSSGKPAEGVVAAHEAMRLDPQRRDVYAFVEGRAYVLMGRYEEAIPPLKTYLTHHSNIIPGHLMLIVCYVELGRNGEARAEATEVMRSNPQFSLAVQKQMAPMKQAFRDRFFGDMAKAGLK